MIAVDHLTVRVGAFALEDVSFSVPAGRYAVLMGRTGAGKTTLLEALCGLKPVTGGTIRLHERDVTRLKSAERGIGYVPQDRALFQTMTVREHLALALVIRQAGREFIRQRVTELSRLLGIEHLLERKPPGLSGGEAQRVALGRALSVRPGILCLDEHQQVTLVVADNGIGLPSDLDLIHSSSLGLQLIRVLTDQLNGKLEMHNHGGAEFRITFAIPQASDT